MVENIPSVNCSTGVLVAKSLVCTMWAEIPLSVLNLGENPVTLHKLVASLSNDGSVAASTESGRDEGHRGAGRIWY